MSSLEKLRVGVIGPGGAGRGRTREFARRSDVEVVAAADVSVDVLNRLESFLAEHVEGFKPGSIKRYVGEYEFIEMIDKEDLDIVGIFSPHSLHDIHSKYALRNDMHVLVEKPMANVVGDAILMAKIADGHDKHLVIHYQRHYSPLYVTARKAYREGMIGELRKFDVYLAQRWFGGGWRGDPRFSGGGQPNDSGSHLQDIFLWITGLLPKTVAGYTSNVFEQDGKKIERPIEIDAVVDVEMENGATGTITILGNTTTGFREWVILEGDEGTLEIREGKLILKTKSGEPKEVPQERPEGFPHSNIDNLVGLIKGQYQINYTSAINGVRTSWLTNSILQTGKGPENKRSVDCEEILRKEGFSLQFIKDMIAEWEAKGRL
jgi:predicted dehydrogenase